MPMNSGAPLVSKLLSSMTSNVSGTKTMKNKSTSEEYQGSFPTVPLYLNMAARNSASVGRNGEAQPNPMSLRLAAAQSLTASLRRSDSSAPTHRAPMSKETLIRLLDEALAIGNDIDLDSEDDRMTGS